MIDRRRLGLPAVAARRGARDHARGRAHLASHRGLDLDADDVRRVRGRARRVLRALGGGSVRPRARLDRVHLARGRRTSRSQVQILLDTLSSVMMLIVSGVGGLIVWYSMGYMAGDDEERRYFAYMSLFVFAMLLLVAGGELPPAARGLGARRARLLPPDRVLAPAAGGGRRREEGVRHERDRRRDARARARPAHLADRHARVRRRLRPGRLPLDHHGEPRRARPPRRRGGEVGPDPAAHMASGRDGGTDAGLGADPRRDDGDGGGLPARPGEPDLRGRARRAAPRLDPRRGHAARRRSHRARAVGHQARDRLLDDVPDRLHVPGGGDRRVRVRDLPPHDARLLQGAAVHVGGARDPPPGRGAGHPEDGRPPVGRCRARTSRSSSAHSSLVGIPIFSGVLVEGRHRRRGVRERRRARLQCCTSPGSSARSSPASTPSGSTSPSSAASRASS